MYPRARLLLAIFWLAGCTTNTPHIVPGSDWKPQKPSSVLLVPLTVRVFDLRAGGFQEEKLRLSQQARSNMLDAVAGELRLRGFTSLVYGESQDRQTWGPHHAYMTNLHSRVRSAVVHSNRLPTQRREPNLDYGLGGMATDLGRDLDARYALFLSHSEGFATTGRKVVAALFAVGMASAPTRPRGGYASLVDLSDGKILWFRDIESLAMSRRAKSGDLGTQDDAEAFIKVWFGDLPL